MVLEGRLRSHMRNSHLLLSQTGKRCRGYMEWLLLSKVCLMLFGVSDVKTTNKYLSMYLPINNSINTFPNQERACCNRTHVQLKQRRLSQLASCILHPGSAIVDGTRGNAFAQEKINARLQPVLTSY